MPKTKPASTLNPDELAEVNPSFLDSRDLDLDDILSQAEINLSIRQTAKEKKVAKARAKPEADEPVKAKPSPWRATKVILLVQETQCRCGTTFLHPAAKMPLAHFDHIHKPDTIWEVAAHPSTLNKELPRETRILIDHVECCSYCFGEGS